MTRNKVNYYFDNTLIPDVHALTYIKMKDCLVNIKLVTKETDSK